MDPGDARRQWYEVLQGTENVPCRTCITAFWLCPTGSLLPMGSVCVRICIIYLFLVRVSRRFPRISAMRKRNVMPWLRVS